MVEKNVHLFPWNCPQREKLTHGIQRRVSTFWKIRIQNSQVPTSGEAHNRELPSPNAQTLRPWPGPASSRLLFVWGPWKSPYCTRNFVGRHSLYLSLITTNRLSKSTYAGVCLRKVFFTQFYHKIGCCIMRFTESYFSFYQSCSPFYVKVSRKNTLCYVCAVLWSAWFCLNICYSKSSGCLLQVPLWGQDVVLSDFNNPICWER